MTATYNRLDLTREYLASLARTLAALPDAYEVILVDDASTDGTQAFLRELAGPYTVLCKETNRGYAAANNAGARLARGDCLLLLNNDLILTPGWIEPMLAQLRSGPEVGAVGNVQVNVSTDLLEHAGVFFDLEGVPAHARKYRKRAPAAPLLEWPAVTGACLGVRREVFWEVGGFDEAYVNGHEDIDLCLKLRAAGYRNFVCNRSVVYHHVSSSPGSHSRKAENEKRFMDKWQAVTRDIGRHQWPREYLQRYARKWWRSDPDLVIKAAWMLLTGRS